MTDGDNAREQQTTLDVAVLEAMLVRLADIQQQRERVATAIMDAPSTAEIANAYARLQAEIALATADLDVQIAGLRQAIEQGVLQMGRTVRTEQYVAVLSKPRVTWDAKLLDGYAAAHPEILPFRHVAQPSVTIRPARRQAGGG